MVSSDFIKVFISVLKTLSLSFIIVSILNASSLPDRKWVPVNAVGEINVLCDIYHVTHQVLVGQSHYGTSTIYPVCHKSYERVFGLRLLI